MKKLPVSRRKFVKVVSAFTLGAPFASKASSFNILSDYEKENGFLNAFNYEDVRLTNGVLKQQFDRILKVYMSLDNDSLLKPMREAAGMATPGRDMGGWYDAGPGLRHLAPGHCFGQIVAGLSRFYAITKEEAIKQKVEQLVQGFDETIRVDDGPYFKELRYPSYTYDKHVLGLVDAYSLAGVKQALEVLTRATRQAEKYLPEKALTRQEMEQRPHKDRSYTWDESYILPENLFNTFQISGDTKYKALATKYLHNEPYFIPLANGVPAFVNQHAYSHFNALSSAAKAYEVLKDPMYLKAIINAWDMIEKTQQYASGGWGPNEAFIEPGKGLLGKSLTSTKHHFEAPCGSYAHCKLGRYLIRFTKDSRYGDNMERMIFNTTLAAKDPQADGSAFYYLNHAPLAKKEYHPDRCPCCFGSLPLVISDYVQNIYFHHDDSLYVNLYTGSAVTWKLNGTTVAIEQHTDYPNESVSHFKIALNKPQRFTMHLRIPAWVDPNLVGIEVNGAPLKFDGKSGSYYAVRRLWKNSDTIKIHLPFTAYTLPVDEQHPNLVAFMHGPLMLGGVEPSIKLESGNLVRADKEFRTTYTAGSVQFKPLYLIGDEVYTSYFYI